MNAEKVIYEVNDVIERLKLNFAPINVNYETHQAFHGAIQPLYKLSRELKNEMQRVETTSHWFANAIKEIDEMIAYHNKAKETAQGNFWYANHEICNNLHRVKRILINHAFQSNEGDENPDVLQFMQIILNNDKLAKCTVGMTTEQRACTFAYNEGFKAAMAAVNEFLMQQKRATKMTIFDFLKQGMKVIIEELDADDNPEKFEEGVIERIKVDKNDDVRITVNGTTYSCYIDETKDGHEFLTVDCELTNIYPRTPYWNNILYKEWRVLDLKNAICDFLDDLHSCNLDNVKLQEIQSVTGQIVAFHKKVKGGTNE